MRCQHCQSEIPAGWASTRFCCAGCEAVYGLLAREGLERFHELAANARLAPAAAQQTGRSLAWLEPLLATAEAVDSSITQLSLDVQGVQCAACVWLITELFRRQSGSVNATLNPALGRVTLRWSKGQCDLAAFVRHVESFGYRLGPALKERTADALTWRLGVCVALTINVMLFSVSFYFGLSRDDAELFQLFTALCFALSTVSVVVGGWPFFRSAYRGVRAGVLHLDLPIALGIVLVYATSLVQALAGKSDLAYLDTLNTFITLMLVGRWLQRRVIEKNRAFLLDDAGLDGLVCRRVEGETVRVVAASAVRAGDELLIAPKELVPVDAELLGEQGSVSLDWLSGESAPRALVRGATVQAGSFNASDSALHLCAKGAVDASALPALLAPVATGLRADAFWNTLAKGWAWRVLLISVGGFVLWLPKGLSPALDVAVALLVVTCPCAIGLSIPLAYELVQSRLRRQGFFAKSEDLLDRLRAVKKVLFDKTGTLTTNRLELAGLPDLTTVQRDLAFNLATRSSHPKSAAIAEALQHAGARFEARLVTHELPGVGVECQLEGRTFRLGRGDGGPTLYCDGIALATFELREALRPRADEQVRSLAARGYEVWLISGDSEERVQAMAGRLGIAPAHARSAQSPAEKAALVRQLDARDTLYLGDGVNDAPAFAAALCAGTPAIDRPVMPSRSAFFFVGEGLGALGTALDLSRKLHRVVRRVLTFSIAYNVLAVGAGLCGLITPLRAAIFMPASSLSILLFTLWSLREPRTRRAAPKLEEVLA